MVRDPDGAPEMYVDDQRRHSRMPAYISVSLIAFLAIAVVTRAILMHTV